MCAMNVHSLLRQGVNCKGEHQCNKKDCLVLPFPGFPCVSLSAAYPLLFPGKHLSEESPRNQPENRLSP